MAYKFQKCLISLFVLFVCVPTIYAAQNSLSSSKIEEIESALDNWEAVIDRARKISSEKSWDGVYEKLKKTSLKPEMRELPIFEEKYSRENNDFSKAKKHEFKVTIDTAYYKYESIDYKRVGIMYGINPSYTYRPGKNDFLYNPYINLFEFDSNFNIGKFDLEYEDPLYTGLTNHDRDNFIFDLRSLLGKEFVSQEYSLALFSGFGYKFQQDKPNDKYSLGKSGDGLAWYGMDDHKIKHYYVPVGCTFKKSVNEKWNVSFNGEYDALIYGLYRRCASEFSSSLPDQKYEQKLGYGLRGSLMLERKSENVNFIFGPFIRFWNIDTSDPITIGDEDYGVNTNKTYEYGLNVGLKF